MKKELYAEFLGTLVLIAFGAGVVAQVNLSGQQNGAYISINIAWGLGVTLAVYVAAGVSGAHLNPAVTLARSLSDTFAGIRPADVLPFVAIQFIAALVATAFCRWLYFYRCR